MNRNNIEVVSLEEEKFDRSYFPSEMTIFSFAEIYQMYIEDILKCDVGCIFEEIQKRKKTNVIFQKTYNYVMKYSFDFRTFIDYCFEVSKKKFGELVPNIYRMNSFIISPLSLEEILVHHIKPLSWEKVIKDIEYIRSTFSNEKDVVEFFLVNKGSLYFYLAGYLPFFRYYMENYCEIKKDFYLQRKFFEKVFLGVEILKGYSKLRNVIKEEGWIKFIDILRTGNEI